MTAVATVDRATIRTTAAVRSHLPGLDGLRGVAVLLVLAYHAFPSRLPGGFAGVDVFFVLSGFLITTLLLREKNEHGRVQLGRFWVRRIRRLVPALLAMLVVVTGLTVLVGNDTGAGLRSQVLGALTWTSNWIQIHQGWSYTDSHLPPLLNHLWSLGIEEQFYLLWPLLVVGALAVMARRRTQQVTVALALVSVGLMTFWYQVGEPNRAYMGLDSHAFGLLLGAGLALSRVPHLLEPGLDGAGARSSRLRTAAGVVGLLVIGAFSVFVAWSSAVTFLGGLALLNLAAVAVILAATTPGPVAAGLGWLPLRWIGERSYGLYLWHWPLIVFAVRLAHPDDAEAAAGVALVVALLMAAASYRFVEVPMRRDGIRATFRGWFGVLRGEDGRDAVVARLVATMVSTYLVLAGAALSQAPSESEVETLLSAGEEVAVDSVDDLDTVPEPMVQPLPAQPARLCQSVPPGTPLSAFGDSVTVAIAPVLAGRRPGTTAVAAVGWQYGDVATAIRQTAAAGQLQQTVLIATGTNGIIDPADLEALLTNELAGRQVALVVPSVPGRSWSEQAMQTVGAAAAAHDNVHLVDWNIVATQNAGLTASDGVHPNAQGQNVFNDLIDQSLAAC
ncbi:acyltransferase family protein [Aeromicrobium sp. Leaf350]|uniref:acyltransferase family protein n=1 Tax=Aeromicrobium sp. Leaf350 TaxID=2876565 RepID=UPI001E46D6C4|nr:acyltransferase family protein [Aeromicrobium sp. Leaf350]